MASRIETVSPTPSEGRSITPSYYCAGAIRGDKSFEKYIDLIRNVVRKYGEPYTEKSETYAPLDPYISNGDSSQEKKVYERDMYWLRSSRAVIAEVSGASTGTGFEIREAIAWDIPVYCLYMHGSRLSLIIKQCVGENRNVTVQEYNEDRDLEAYLTLYMHIVSHTARPSVIRHLYKQKATELKSVDFRIDKILPSVDEALADLQDRYPAIEVDFQNSETVIPFMIRNMILQIRWERLRTQKIGETFASASLPRVIRALVHTAKVKPSVESSLATAVGNGAPLVQENGVVLICDYERILKQRTGYREKALVKNLKAFATIGLLMPQGSPKSAYLTRQTLVLTEHCKKLSVFLERYGNFPLRDLLAKFRKSEWYGLLSDLPEAKSQNVDTISVGEILRKEWSDMLIKYLNKRLSALGILSKKRRSWS